MASTALGGEYTVLFNGIEVERFAKATPWPTDGPTVFFCGRHEPRKGLAVLLDAMKRLPADVRLWVGSDGPDTAALRAATAGDDRIEWLGRLDEDEKARRLRGADVFCCPSLRGESFGVVLLEGMAAQHAGGRQSDLPGYRNVGRAGADVLLVPPGDPAALASALTRVLGDSSLAAELVASGEQRADEYSMDNLAERYARLYEQVGVTRHFDYGKIARSGHGGSGRFVRKWTSFTAAAPHAARLSPSHELHHSVTAPVESHQRSQQRSRGRGLSPADPSVDRRRLPQSRRRTRLFGEMASAPGARVPAAPWRARRRRRFFGCASRRRPGAPSALSPRPGPRGAVAPRMMTGRRAGGGTRNTGHGC